MTETKPDTAAEPAPAPAPGAVAVRDSWISTGDHKRIGRAWIALSILYVALGGVIGGLLSAERLSPGFDLFDEGDFTQFLTLHGISAAYLFLLPAWIGVASVVVPLQVGARNLVTPRLASLAFWGFAVGGAILLASYAADGGPGGPDTEASELWITGFGLVVVSLIAGLIAVVATAIAGRAPGLTLAHVPAFTWGVLAGGLLWLLTLPVMLAMLVLGWIDLQHNGQLFDGDFFAPLGWAFGPPTTYLFAVPAAGAITDVLATATGARARPWPATAIGLGGLALLGFGAWAATPITGAEVRSDFLYQAMGLAVVAPVLLLVASWADIGRRHERLVIGAAPLYAIGAIVALVVGTGAGMALTTDRLDLVGTTFAGVHVHSLTLGASLFGLLAAFHHWAPKLWGATLNEALGRTAFALLFVGVNLLLLPDLISGIDKMPAGQPRYGDDGSWEVLSQIAGAGAAVTIVGVLLALGAVASAIPRRRQPTPDNPVGGHTLEWATASPPVRHNFDTLPPIRSSEPLLDADPAPPQEQA